MANVSDFTMRAPSAAARTPRWIDEASQQLKALSHPGPCTGESDDDRGTIIDDQLGTIDGEALNLTSPRRVGGKRVGYPVGEAMQALGRAERPHR